MAKKREAFLPMFCGDFFSATAEWEGEEEALYALLLMRQWSLGHLPTEVQKLARLVKYDPATFERWWPTVSSKFEVVEVPEKGHRLINRRLEEHREKSLQLSKKNSHAGALGAEAKKRKGSERHPSGEANATGSGSERHKSATAPIAKQSIPSHPIPSHPIRPQDSEGSSGGEVIRNSNSEGGEGNGRDFSSEGSPPKDPSPRKGAAAERRNGDFEAINDAVEKLISAGVCNADNPRELARVAHISEHQAEISISQLRDRGRLPAVAA